MLSKFSSDNVFKSAGFWGVLLALVIFLPITSFSLEITIDVAPNVLNLQNNGQVVTIHTDIDYHLVQASTVYLNGIAIQSYKSDLRGNFVAKFDIEAVKDLPLVIDGYNTLTMEGVTTTNEEFFGSQDILVIDKSAVVKTRKSVDKNLSRY